MSSGKPIVLGDHKALLETHEQDYYGSRRDDRSVIVDSIIKELVTQTKVRLDKDAKSGLVQVSQLIYVEPSEISSTWTQKIQTWYGNRKNVPLRDESTLVPVGTVWNYRLVVQHVFKDTIAEKMKNTGLTHTDKGWIREYQMAVNSVIQSLGGEEKVVSEYGEMAKSWNEVEPPEELKRRCVLV